MGRGQRRSIGTLHRLWQQRAMSNRLDNTPLRHITHRKAASNQLQAKEPNSGELNSVLATTDANKRRDRVRRAHKTLGLRALLRRLVTRDLRRVQVRMRARDATRPRRHGRHPKWTESVGENERSTGHWSRGATERLRWGYRVHSKDHWRDRVHQARAAIVSRWRHFLFARGAKGSMISLYIFLFLSNSCFQTLKNTCFDRFDINSFFPLP